jgi:2-oxoglutarate dehydrogenase E2 component (dihydrolipoamide succinyltransferase)
MPQLGETVTEGTVSAWHKKVGDSVRADEALLDVETDKVATEIIAPVAGTVAEIRVKAGETVDVGAILAVIQEEGNSAAYTSEAYGSAVPAAIQDVAISVANASPSPGKLSPEGVQPSNWVGVAPPPSPAVRRLLAEHHLTPETISGTGKDGRITKGDVLDHIARQRRAPEDSSGIAAFSDVKPFSRIRKITAERMMRSKITSAHVLQAVEVDFTSVDKNRDRIKADWKKKHGFSLSYLPYIAKAACDALKDYPDLNSSVEGDGLLLHKGVNLAIAVDLGAAGLVAPIILAADELSVSRLAHAINQLSSRARAGDLKNHQMSGGTYTISNSGTFGTLITAPIINQPQVAILSVDGIRKRAVVVEHSDGDAVVIRQVGILAQSFDHRAVDGAYSAAFLNSLRERLERGEWNAEL